MWTGHLTSELYAFVNSSDNISLMFCLKRTIYTCALNDRGGVEIDLTVTPVESGAGELHDPIFKGRGENHNALI